MKRILEWIPVTDRYPEYDGSYIVCTLRGGVYISHYYAPRPGIRTKGYFSHNGKVPIIAWMERPTPLNNNQLYSILGHMKQ